MDIIRDDVGYLQTPTMSSATSSSHDATENESEAPPAETMPIDVVDNDGPVAIDVAQDNTPLDQLDATYVLCLNATSCSVIDKKINDHQLIWPGLYSLDEKLEQAYPSLRENFVLENESHKGLQQYLTDCMSFQSTKKMMKMLSHGVADGIRFALWRVLKEKFRH